MPKTETAAPVVLPAPVIPVRKPFAISIGASAQAALAELVALARQGYTINTDAPIDFSSNGWLFMTAHLGDPHEHHVKQAQEAAELALMEEERQRTKEIQAEARRIVEEQQRIAADKEIAALRAEQARQIAAIQAEAAARIAALQQ